MLSPLQQPGMRLTRESGMDEQAGHPEKRDKIELADKAGCS